MGMSASAYLFFGIDLGGNEDYPMRFDISEELEELFEEDEMTSIVEGFIDEFIGWTEPEINWRDESQRDARQEQRVRYQALLKKFGIGFASYGYEYGSYYISAGDVAHTYEESAPINFGEGRDNIDSDFSSRPYKEHVENLIKFVDFLDTKGFYVLPEFREPRWYMTASYS